MEGFDNEVEKATPRGCSAAKQRSADSNTAERERPKINFPDRAKAMSASANMADLIYKKPSIVRGLASVKGKN